MTTTHEPSARRRHDVGTTHERHASDVGTDVDATSRTHAGEEQSRAEQSRYLDGNSPPHVPRPQRANDDTENTATHQGEREEIQEWVRPLMRRMRSEWPRRDWKNDDTGNIELATVLNHHGETIATQAITHLIRNHPPTDRFPPATSTIHATCKAMAEAERTRRQARAANALTHDRKTAPPWYSHLYAAAVRRSAGITPNPGDTNPTPFLAIVDKYDINPGDTAPPEALREAEAAWINAGSPDPLNPAALITNAS